MEVKAGYKKTEIGIIPDDWDIQELQYISKIIDSLHQTPKFSNEGYAMVRVSDIKTGNLSLSKTLKVNEDIFLMFTNNYIPKRNDIVLSRVGSYGVSSFVNQDEPFCMGQNTVVIVPKLNNKYIYFSLNSNAVKNQIENESFGTGYKSLSLKNIKELSIPFPPLPEQKAIAEVLSDTDNLIQALEKRIAKKRLIKQGAMQKLLTPKEDWEVKKLGEIAEVVGGGTPNTFMKKYWNGAINWFTPTEIGINKYAFESIRKITEEGLKNSSAKILPIETVLLTSRAGIGDLSILRLEGCTNQGFQSLIAKELIHNEFLYYLMTSLKKVLIQNASGSTFLEISPNRIKQIDVSIPNYKEQTSIATILSDMDSEIEALEKKLAKYKQLKQGLMQELLTGKTRLIVNGEL